MKFILVALVSVLFSLSARATPTVASYFLSNVNTCNTYKSTSQTYSNLEEIIRELKSQTGQEAQIAQLETLLQDLDLPRASHIEAAVVLYNLSGEAEPHFTNIKTNLGEFTIQKAMVTGGMGIGGGQVQYRVIFTLAGLCPYWPTENKKMSAEQIRDAFKKAWAALQ